MSSKKIKISILVDDPQSWIVPYAQSLKDLLRKDYSAGLYFKASDIPVGDILFLLGCTRIISEEVLKRNKHNLVIHESDLPKGKGWSPLSWQVLEGKNKIPVVLFEAVEDLDAGPIYFKDFIELDGTELLPEIKKQQGEKTIGLVLKFLRNWPNIHGKPQEGEATYYPKRTFKDDELDPGKSIIENFNKLRIVDNEKYPAWFVYNGCRYKIKIYPYD